MTPPCPVCWRPVEITPLGCVEYHADTAGRPCPMSRRYMTSSKERENARA